MWYVGIQLGTLSSFLQEKIREVLIDVHGGIPDERMSSLSLNLSSLTAGIVLSAFSLNFLFRWAHAISVVLESSLSLFVNISQTLCSFSAHGFGFPDGLPLRDSHCVRGMSFCKYCKLVFRSCNPPRSPSIVVVSSTICKKVLKFASCSVSKLTKSALYAGWSHCGKPQNKLQRCFFDTSFFLSFLYALQVVAVTWSDVWR